jgi:hypothetical protein
MREEEKWAGLASKGAPVDALESAEVGRTEVKRTTVEQNGTTVFVDFPESAAVVAFLVPREEVAVHIDVSELEDAFVGDDEFLIHGENLEYREQSTEYNCLRDFLLCGG